MDKEYDDMRAALEKAGYGFGPKWTTTPPTEPGWYWTLDHEDWRDVKNGGKARPQVVHIVRERDGLHYWVPGYEVEDPDDDRPERVFTDDYFTHWLGPLPVPEPPT